MYDRYWRLRVLGALASGVFAVAFGVWYLLRVLPIDLRAGSLALTAPASLLNVR